MIFLWMLGLALLLMLPLPFALRRGRPATQLREAALALHAGQLQALERDLADARIAAAEYGAAKLEVERRLLAADALREPAPTGDARWLLVGAILAVPVLAFALYLPGSTPSVPSEPHARWLARQQQDQARLADFVARIRAHLAALDPQSADASQGEAYLAEALAEQAGTITPEAVALFRRSLSHAPAGALWRQLDEQRLAQANPP